MNERIKSLLARAHLEHPDNPNAIAIKFAELILKESIEILQEQREQSIEMGWKVDESFACAIMHIEENFGLEP